VLEYTWARFSIEAGRALLIADNWGGCKAVDGGVSDADDDGDLDGEQAQPKKKSPQKRKSVFNFLLAISMHILITPFKKSSAHSETNSNRASACANTRPGP
jgi:hypothetical protein